MQKDKREAVSTNFPFPYVKKYRNSNYTILHGLINGETKRYKFGFIYKEEKMVKIRGTSFLVYLVYLI